MKSAIIIECLNQSKPGSQVSLIICGFIAGISIRLIALQTSELQSLKILSKLDESDLNAAADAQNFPLKTVA